MSKTIPALLLKIEELAAESDEAKAWTEDESWMPLRAAEASLLVRYIKALEGKV